jgi:hypothetical protein
MLSTRAGRILELVTMKPFRPLAGLVLVTSLLGACATSGPTPYQPAQSGQFGFTEQRIEQNRFRITFEGNSRTTRERVEDSLLLRAADVTLQNQYDWFQIVTRATDPKTYSVPVPGSSFAYSHSFASYRAFHPRFGWVVVHDPFWSPFGPFGSRWGSRWDDGGTREVTRFQATAEVILGRGPKPAGRPDVFDARDVSANLTPRLASAAATPK